MYLAGNSPVSFSQAYATRLHWTSFHTCGANGRFLEIRRVQQVSAEVPPCVRHVITEVEQPCHHCHVASTWRISCFPSGSQHMNSTGLQRQMKNAYTLAALWSIGMVDSRLARVWNFCISRKAKCLGYYCGSIYTKTLVTTNRTTKAAGSRRIYELCIALNLQPPLLARDNDNKVRPYSNSHQ